MRAMWEREGIRGMVGSEGDNYGGRDAEALVWGGTNKGGSMPTTQTVYRKVAELVNKKGGDVKGCCRSIAAQLHLPEGEVEVLVAGENDKWYKELGFNVKK